MSNFQSVKKLRKFPDRDIRKFSSNAFILFNFAVSVRFSTFPNLFPKGHHHRRHPHPADGLPTLPTPERATVGNFLVPALYRTGLGKEPTSIRETFRFDTCFLGFRLICKGFPGVHCMPERRDCRIIGELGNRRGSSRPDIGGSRKSRPKLTGN